MPKRGRPVAVGSVVPQVLAELGLGEAAAVLRIQQAWEAAAGAAIAAHARPAVLRGTLLEVAVDSSAWAQHLMLERPRILAALRERLGDAAPRDLRVRLG
jgi:predicted nucleic acid-binding Zn ribbon protein